jgi:hypothetical protein
VKFEVKENKPQLKVQISHLNKGSKNDEKDRSNNATKTAI